MQTDEKTYLCCTGGTVDRKTGKVTLHTYEGTREQFIACITPILAVFIDPKTLCKPPKKPAKRD